MTGDSVYLVTGDKTDKWLGVCEMLVMTSVGGVMFSLLAAQPLTIVGATGPLLLFEESLYVVSQIAACVRLETIITNILYNRHRILKS